MPATTMPSPSEVGMVHGHTQVSYAARVQKNRSVSYSFDNGTRGTVELCVDCRLDDIGCMGGAGGRRVVNAVLGCDETVLSDYIYIEDDASPDDLVLVMEALTAFHACDDSSLQRQAMRKLYRYLSRYLSRSVKSVA